jgi:hypothetical protein
MNHSAHAAGPVGKVTVQPDGTSGPANWAQADPGPLHIPFALVPLTRRGELMGALVNRPVTTAAGAVVSAVIIALDVVLLAAPL